MTRTPENAIPAEWRKKRRILAFGSYPLATFCPQFLEYVQEHGDALFFIATRSVEEFLSRGFEAFSLTELREDASKRPDLEVSEDDVRALMAFNEAKADLQGWSAVGEDRASLRRHCEELLRAYRLLFDSVRPHAVITWNGVTVEQGAPLSIARERGLPTFALERGLLPNTMTIDPQGVNYGSHIAGAGWKQAEAPAPNPTEKRMLDAYRAELISKGRTIVSRGETLDADKARARLNIPNDHRMVLFPLQIERDSNIINYSPHYKRMPDAIEDLQRALEETQNTTLVVRPHPEDKNRMDELRKLCGSNTRLDNELSLHSQLRAADAVVVINSTVGLEALVQHKPVAVLGSAIYGEKGFTFDLNERAEIGGLMRRLLREAERGAFAAEEFDRFLLYLLKRCLFPLDIPDAWDSRSRITEQIVSACDAPPSTPPPETLQPEVARLKAENESWRQLLTSETDAGERASILLMRPSPERERFFRNAFPRAEIDVIQQGNATSLLHVLKRRYDFALLRGPVEGNRRRLWKLVRAAHKMSA